MNRAIIQIGVDISKNRLDVFYGDTRQAEAFANTPAGVLTLATRLATREESVRICYEATGGYEKTLEKHPWPEPLRLARLDAARVHQLRQALGQQAKTDRLDAEALSHCGSLLPGRAPVTDETLRAIKEVSGRRRQLVAQRATLLKQKQQTDDALLLEQMEALQKLLSEQIETLNKRLLETILRSQALQAKARLLEGVPGVGPVLVQTLLACMPELGDVNGKEIAALAGLAPFARQSGTKTGKAFIRGGRSSVRHVLYMATLSAVRSNAVLKTFYRKLIDSGKPAKLALTACMRKFIVILNAILAKQSPWKPA